MIYNHSLKARAVCAIALTTCLLLGPQVLMADAPKPETPEADSTRVGTLQTSAGVYTFTPRSCLIHIEDGVPDIEIQGPGTAPEPFCRNAKSPSSSSLSVISAPPTTSECPPMYLVVECSTTSAPQVSGVCR